MKFKNVMHARSFKFLLPALILWCAVSSAHEVNIEWMRSPGAIKHELLILRGGKTVLSKVFGARETKWTGQLPFGEYAYQMRAIDSLKRPGSWSEPQAFSVTPPAPKLKHPGDGAIVVPLGVTLSWTGSPEIRRYYLEVETGTQSVLKQMVEGTKFTLPRLSPKEYQWKVSPVIDDIDANNSIISSRILHQSASEPSSFLVQAPRDVTTIPPEILESEVSLSAPSPEDTRYLLGAGLMTAIAFHVPYFGLSRSLGPKWATDVRIGYATDSSSSASLSMFGLSLGLSYFFLATPFDGPFASGSFGGTFFSGQATGGSPETALSTTVSLSGGWQRRWKSGLHLAAAGGIQYITPPSLSVRTRVRDAQPLILLQVGYVF